MKALLKTDFEKWLISQLTAEGSLYYLTVDSKKVYFFFEGQSITTKDNFVNLQIRALDTTRIATDAKYHTGTYNFYIYGLSVLMPDKVTDALGDLLDEVLIEETGGFRIELGILSTKYRGNRFQDSTHYENIIEIPYHHWEC